MPPPAPLLFQCNAPKAGSIIEPNIATTTHACFQVELNGHASAKEGLSPHLAEVSMPPPAPLLFQCNAPKAGSIIEPNIATTTHACFQVELNGHASAKEGLSPHLAEVSMPPPAPLLFQCNAPKAGNTIEPNIATTTTVKKDVDRTRGFRGLVSSLPIRRPYWTGDQRAAHFSEMDEHTVSVYNHFCI
ncbi:hypothetical protein ACJJTC_014288 [Scirpophaga incertulas]